MKAGGAHMYCMFRQFGEGYQSKKRLVNNNDKHCKPARKNRTFYQPGETKNKKQKKKKLSQSEILKHLVIFSNSSIALLLGVFFIIIIYFSLFIIYLGRAYWRTNYYLSILASCNASIPQLNDTLKSMFI